MSFKAHVEDINNAATKLSSAKSPSLSAGGAPNVGATDGAAGYAGSYDVWLATRKEDYEGAQEQVDSLVRSIRAAAKSYDDVDANAKDTFVNALTDDFKQIDR